MTYEVRHVPELRVIYVNGDAWTEQMAVRLAATLLHYAGEEHDRNACTQCPLPGPVPAWPIVEVNA